MSTTERFGFTHYFQAPRVSGAPVFMVLHGLGGTEHDFIPLVAETNMDAGIISLRGGASCGGKTCFFTSNKDGTYDPEYLQEHAKTMVQFVNRAAEAYRFDRSQVIWLGYGNGADSIANTMFTYPTVVNRAILLRPSVTRIPEKLPVFADVSVLIAAGRQDEIIPIEDTEKLIRAFQHSGAVVELFLHDATHLVTPADALHIRQWYTRHAEW
ncbi:MAG: dienelactone hydrolase family protein [Patescibacteria group bacterium]|nr:dienelactone hydrolase family protein [Patescibacteria group bacterium]